MPTLNELKYASLLGSTASTPPVTINELEVKYLTGLGYTGTVNEMWIQFLEANGATPGPLDQMWSEYLGGLGYTGTLNEKLYGYWSPVGP